jgi:hypothetical protein
VKIIYSEHPEKSEIPIFNKYMAVGKPFENGIVNQIEIDEDKNVIKVAMDNEQIFIFQIAGMEYYTFFTKGSTIPKDFDLFEAQRNSG